MKESDLKGIIEGDIRSTTETEIIPIENPTITSQLEEKKNLLVVIY
jgi:hypothetical protein